MRHTSFDARIITAAAASLLLLLASLPAPGAAEAEPSLDADSDGVLDADDLCPGTPAGHAVDAAGCSAAHCSEVVSAASAQCFEGMSARLHECHAGTGRSCAENDAAVASLRSELSAAVVAACGSDSAVRAAGFGAALTASALRAQLEESCQGNATQLASRAFGGPHAKVRNAATSSEKACLDAGYAEASALIRDAHDSFARCILDGACSSSGPVDALAIRAAQAETAITAACALSGTDIDLVLGTPADLFVERALKQAQCFAAESHGDARSAALECGPDDARFSSASLFEGSQRIPLSSVDDIPRGVPVQIVMDSDVWGTRCGDGSPYAFWIKLAPEDEPIENVQFSMHGGGACLTPADCAVYADPGKFTALNDGAGMVVLRSDDPRNPLRNWSQVVMPYCTQDLHLGGGTMETYVSPEDPGTSGILYRYGAVNVRAAFEFVRDLMWRRLRDAEPEGYRPDGMQVIHTGNSAGGYGVFYNYHFPLEELRWSNTLAHPHAAFIIDGGTVDVNYLVNAKAEAWNIRPFLPSYCHFPECASSRFHVPAYSERIDDRFPLQRLIVSISQHDPSGESQQYRGDPPSGWINGARKLYCDLKNARTPNVNFFLPVPKDGTPQHGFLEEQILDRDSPLSQRMSADGINVVDWLGEIVADPDGGYDAVEEHRLVEFVPGVKPFVAFGCAVDGEDLEYEEPPPTDPVPGLGAQTGCTAVGSPGPNTGDQTCTYVADGPGTYRALTQNLWRIEALRDGETLVLAMGANPVNVGGGDPKVGILGSQAGDVVTVTLVYNANFGGTHGAVSAGDVIGGGLVPLPEPAGAAMVGAGAVLLAFLARRARRSPDPLG